MDNVINNSYCSDTPSMLRFKATFKGHYLWRYLRYTFPIEIIMNSSDWPHILSKYKFKVISIGTPCGSTLGTLWKTIC